VITEVEVSDNTVVIGDSGVTKLDQQFGFRVLGEAEVLACKP